MDELLRAVEISELTAAEIHARTRAIYEATIAESSCIASGNFTSIHPRDLERLFDLYDGSFFAGRCREALGERKLVFRLSRRMSRAGGKTARHRMRTDPRNERYEIAVSATLLFQTFHDVSRTVQVTGLVCADRLEALQRILEHELVHLLEMLLWDRSNCSAERFQSIARRFFGHTHHRHELVTVQERAEVEFGIRPGSRVRFVHEGRPYTGIVNRLTRRATVLVEHPDGRPYRDGKRYARFYVPLARLEPADG